MFDFRRVTISFGDSSTFSKNLGGHGPPRDVVSYCVKRNMSESVTVLL